MHDRVDERLLERSSTFVIAAHELKSPLALIRQLSLELETVDSEYERHDIISQISLISDKALRLTGNITKSANLDQLQLEFEPVNVTQLCEDVAHELSPLYKAMGRRIEVEKRTRPALVVANRELLRRILLGFGDNALHYADAKPARFTITTSNNQALIGLRDSGPITRQQATSELPGRPQSSGLGLEIARRFANVMNGSIGNQKHRDGMTFYVSVQLSTQLSLL